MTSTDGGKATKGESPIEKEWVHAGLKCKVIFVRHAHRCGYVAGPKGHLAYAKSYDDIDVSVHGGLTYGETKDGLTWFGFDCAHSGDAMSGEMAKYNFDRDAHFWILDEVVKETNRLAEQLRDLTESQTLPYGVKEFLRATPFAKVKQLQGELRA
ncbi:MAG: hypothetical protein KGI38_13035 [Thaumarchaeota archaeon]|nr:hypothetical protein [Nitrososphaerota archaeon]